MVRQRVKNSQDKTEEEKLKDLALLAIKQDLL